MDMSQFVTRIRRLHSLQAVTLIFAKTGTVGVGRLLALLKSHPAITVPPNEKVVLFAIATSGDWGHDRNRNVTIFGLSTADDRWLCEIARDVERIDVGDHGAKGLMSSRTVMQKEAMDTIQRQVLTPSFRKEMEDWGISIETDLTFPEAFPVLKFSLKYDNQDAGSIGVDGFSGRIMQNDALEDELFITTDQLQKRISDWVERLIEKLTAA